MSVHSVFVAKERLNNLLSADGIQCTPVTADRLTKDLCLTVSKYREITPEYFDIEITRSDIHIKYAGENK